MVVLSGLLIAVGLAAAPGAGAATAFDTSRISGADRYATAARLSSMAFPNGATEVVLASGTEFADALAASPVAAKRKAPLLLTQRDAVPDATVAELRRLKPQKVLIAGGPAAVSAAVEFVVGLGWPVTRIAGGDRFETAARLAEGNFAAGVPVLFVASGRTGPDALAAGAAAGRLGGPVLLVEPNRLPAAVASAIERLRPTRIVAVGGTTSLSTQVVSALGSRGVERVSGADRYATAAALIDAVPGPSTVGLLASGVAFPDALAAGPSAAAMGANFALAGPSCFAATAAQRMADDGVRQLLVIGGTNALSTAAVTPCSASTSPTPPTTSPPSGGLPSLSVQGSASGDAPDPTVLAVGSTWYAYATEFAGVRLPVRTSTDLRTWSRATEAMPRLAPWVRPGSNWAPSVVQVGSSYVAWYTARESSSNRQCISRAVASNPRGPFVDDLTAPALCQRTLGGSIDPDVFTDSDGSRWLTWKSDENAVGKPSRLWMAQLSGDGRTVSSGHVTILSQSAAWESPTIEQPNIVKSGSTYYLFYSGGWWESSTYGMGYATATSRTGPYTKKTTSTAWVGSSSGATGPGGLDTFTGPSGQLWATFHAWPGVVGYDAGGIRTMRVARLQL
jgi:putative cell wall-binding protein